LFGHKKRSSPPPPVGSTSPPAPMPGQEESMRVLKAFLAPAPAPGNQFVFNITTFEGPESGQPVGGGGPGAPNISIPVPGVGQVSTAQFQQTYEHINGLLRRISGGADLSQEWTVDQVQGALAGLETVNAQGELTDEQYQSLKAALASMLVPR
jgi:hypothetical protein